jgi:hypothetical protein
VLGIARPDLVRVLGANRRHLAINATLGAVQPQLRLELRRRHAAEPYARAVREQGVQLEHVLDGQAVRDRVRATGVVADHSAERRAVGRRGIGAEEQTEIADRMVELVLHEPRLHARPPLVRVDLEDAVHVLREVEHERAVDRLPGERGAAAARQQRDVLAARNVERGDDVVGVTRRDDADRLHLIHGRVRRVEQQRGGIEPDGAADDAAQVALEVVHRAIILAGSGHTGVADGSRWHASCEAVTPA